MRALLAIAHLTIRETFRSRLIWLVLGLVLIVTIGMPPLLKGDGTATGIISMTINYTLATTLSLLVLINLWSSCGLIAREINGRTMALVRVKPVRAWQIWTGKWLGHVVINLLVLLCAYTITGVTVYNKLGKDLESTQVMLHARQLIKPDLPSLAEQMAYVVSQESFTELPAREQREIRRRLRRELPYQTASLDHGQSWNWHFNYSKPPFANQPIWVRLRFDTDAFTRAIVSAQCTLSGSNQKSETVYLADFTSRTIEIPFPSTNFVGDTRLTLTIKHTGDSQTGPLILQPRQGLDLLIPREPLFFNAARSFLLNWSILALLAALGITFGAVFSFPVAAFCATGLLAAILISDYVIKDGDAIEDLKEEENTSYAHRITVPLAIFTARGMSFFAQPIVGSQPLQKLATAEMVATAELRSALLFNLIVFPAGACLISSLVLIRKELPS